LKRGLGEISLSIHLESIGTDPLKFLGGANLINVNVSGELPSHTTKKGMA